MEPTIWLIMVIVLIVIEIITMDLTTIWFAGGALLTFIFSILFNNLTMEVIVFLVTSLSLLYFTRPWVKKHFNPKRIRTNYNAVIGEEALVISTIDNINGTGQVIINGMEWTARSTTHKVIEKGTKVTIKEVTGVRLIVEEISSGLKEE